MTEKIEAYYFEPDEFQNLDNLKDVLEGLGEKTEEFTPLERELRIFADERDLNWNEIREREGYVLEDDISAEYLETDEGIFVISESNVIDENTESLYSRSDQCEINSG